MDHPNFISFYSIIYIRVNLVMDVYSLETFEIDTYTNRGEFLFEELSH